MWLLLYASYALSRPPLPDGAATVHAEIAREMLARNDWTHTYVNGQPVASSSKALDWSIAVSYKLFGVSDWAARLPIALCVLLLVLVVYFFGRSLYGRNAAGLYAALLVLTWPGTFLATRDLTAAPFLYLETAFVAWILWHLLIIRNPPLLKAIGISVVACLGIVVTGTWPGTALPLSILLTCWIARSFVAPEEKRSRLLTTWAGLGFFLSAAWIYPRSPLRGPLLWLAAIAPLSLIVGGWLANNEAFSSPTAARLVHRYFLATGLVVAAIALFFATHGPLAFTANRSSVIVVASSRIALLIAALAFAVGVSGNLFFRLRNSARYANCSLAGMLAGIIVAIQVGQVLNSPYCSSEILADAIRPELDPTDTVIIDGQFADASSFAFYLNRPVSIAAYASAASKPGQPPPGIIAADQAWNGPTRIFLWTRAAQPPGISGKSFVIARSGGKEILSNQPNSGGASF